MPRDTRNSLHIYYLDKGKEVHKIVYPRAINGWTVDWRKFSYDMGYDLYDQGWTEVCKYFNVLVPDDLDRIVHWAWDCIPIPSYSNDLTQKEEDKIKNSDVYKCYKDLFVESHTRECVDSMFSEAYVNLERACKAEYGTERTHRIKTTDDWKDYFDLSYLFYDMLGNQDTNLEYQGAWVLRDGSYIAVGTAHHCRLLKEYMGLSEYDMERYWIKVSMGTVYTHNRMTSAQEKTLNKFFKKYKLEERNIEDW